MNGKKIKKIIAFLLCLPVLAGCTASRPAVPAEKAGWSAGFSKIELLPDDLGQSVYYIAGYRNDNRAEGLLDPQYARAAYISDGSGHNIVLAAVDCIGLSRADTTKIRALVSDTAEEYGLTAVHVMSTHTHAGIDTLGLWGPGGQTGLSDSFMEKVVSGTAQAVRLACEDRREGQLYYGFADTEGLQRDSRLPEIYSPLLHRFRFEPSDGSRGFQIINYGAHPEALRSENSKISADFPAYMGRKIAETTGDEFIFIAGALGGLISTNRLKDSAGKDLPVEENVAATGEILADFILGIDNERALAPFLKSKTEVFKINLDNRAFIAMAFLGVIGAHPEKGGGQYGLALKTEVSLVTIGDINCALVPGELFPELAWGGSAGPLAANAGIKNPPSLAEITGDGDLLVFGLANDEIGYIVSPDDFLVDEDAPYFAEAADINGRGHYEETNSVGIEAAEEIARAFKKLTDIKS